MFQQDFQYCFPSQSSRSDHRSLVSGEHMHGCWENEFWFALIKLILGEWQLKFQALGRIFCFPFGSDKCRALEFIQTIISIQKDQTIVHRVVIIDLNNLYSIGPDTQTKYWMYVNTVLEKLCLLVLNGKISVAKKIGHIYREMSRLNVSVFTRQEKLQLG